MNPIGLEEVVGREQVLVRASASRGARWTFSAVLVFGAGHAAAAAATSSRWDAAVSRHQCVAGTLRCWPEPCEEMFEYLADHSPSELLALLVDESLSPPRLTFAAEIAGRIRGREKQLLEVFEGLLKHEKAYVREGVVYGLAQMSSSGARQLLGKVARNDVDADVRSAATEVLTT
ncbi:MAG: HEAT repeat domain-containing protein [Pseudomonadota bacterium]